MKKEELAIIQGLKRGESEAYHYVFRTYYPLMCHLAQTLMGDQTTAEEVVGDVISHLWEVRETLEVATSLRCMLLAATRNACLNRLKQKYNRLVVTMEGTSHLFLDSLGSGSTGGDGLEALIDEEMQTTLKRAVESLPPLTRRVFEAQRYDRRSLKEIAEQEQMTVPNVKYQMRKAIGILSETLKMKMTKKNSTL